jgi:Mannose-6-phosphate isomerase
MAGSVVYQSEGVKVRHSYLDPGKEIPWHRHSSITDLVFAVRGAVTVETLDPPARLTLNAGDSHHVPAGQPHRVSNPTGARIEFLLIQGVGSYDFSVLDDRADLSSVDI